MDKLHVFMFSFSQQEDNTACGHGRHHRSVLCYYSMRSRDFIRFHSAHENVNKVILVIKEHFQHHGPQSSACDRRVQTQLLFWNNCWSKTM